MIIEGISTDKDGKIILTNEAAQQLVDELHYCIVESKDHKYAGYIQLFHTENGFLSKKQTTLVILP